MGVGRLGIVDRDSVEESNLHRQVAHREADVGRHKAESGEVARTRWLAQGPAMCGGQRGTRSRGDRRSALHFPLEGFISHLALKELRVLCPPSCPAVASCVFAINSSCAAEVYRDGLTPANAVDLVSRFDVVIDASDNAPTRYLANDACVAAGRPLVSGAAIGMGEDGHVSVHVCVISVRVM